MSLCISASGGTFEHWEGVVRVTLLAVGLQHQLVGAAGGAGRRPHAVLLQGVCIDGAGIDAPNLQP